MYAIWNKKTLKWWYGTDYRWHPPHQRTSDERAVTFTSREDAENVMIFRRMNPKRYEIVKVKLYEVEELETTIKMPPEGKTITLPKWSKSNE